MKLFIVRHAHAVDAQEDPKRPLSKKGREQARAMGNFLKISGEFQPREFWHSPLARSVETAELVAKYLGSAARLRKVSGIEGEDDPDIIARKLRSQRRPIAIVGHEPHLSALLSLLVAGSAQPARFVLKKCAVVALEKVDGAWAVRWHVSPGLIDAAP